MQQAHLIHEYLRSRPPGQSAFFGIIPTPRELALPPGRCTDDDIFEQEHTAVDEPVDLKERLTWRPTFPLALLPYYLPDRLCYTLHIQGVYYYYSTRPRADPANTATLDYQRDDFHFECILDPWGRPFNCPCTHSMASVKRRQPMEPITAHDRFIQCVLCKKLSHWDCLSEGHDVDHVANESEWVCGRSRGACQERVIQEGKPRVATKTMPEDEREARSAMLRQMVAAHVQRQTNELLTMLDDEEADEAGRCMDPMRIHDSDGDGPRPVGA